MWLSPAKNAEQMFKRDLSGKGLGECRRKKLELPLLLVSHCSRLMCASCFAVAPLSRHFCAILPANHGFFRLWPPDFRSTLPIPVGTRSDPKKLTLHPMQVPCKYSSTAWTRMPAYDTEWYGKKQLVFSVIIDLIWCKKRLKSQGGPTGWKICGKNPT